MALNLRAIDSRGRLADQGYRTRFDMPDDRPSVTESTSHYGGLSDSQIVFYRLAEVITDAAPTGTDRSLTTPAHYTLRLPDFGFGDTDGNAFASVRIASLATTGTLFYDANGSNGGQRTAVTVGQSISVLDILADRLTFVSSGTSQAAFTFQVRDSNNELDASPNTLTFNPLASISVNNLFGTSINLSGLAIGDGFRLSGPALSGTGSSLGHAGDVNGDGFSDFIVGSAQDDTTAYDAGAAYIVFGRATGFAAVDLTTLNGTTGFKLTGEAEDDLAGISISSAGDINSDGFDDILVGAIANDAGGSQAGAAYVVFGRASGFAATLNLANLTTGNNGFKLIGEAGSDFAGSSVSSAGDINGDGFADIIVGARFQGGGNNGAAYVVFGKASGFGNINLAAIAAGTGGFKITGEASANYMGRAVSSGDVNGDGFSDLIVSAYANSNAGRSTNGAVYVIFGSATLTSAPNLASLNGSNGFKIQGALNADYAGWSASSAGDVNGDGFADILIGQRDYTNGNATNHAGAAYVVFGKANGTYTVPVDLNGISAANGFRIAGENANDYAGITVSAAGDVNGDGFADILVGSITHNSLTGATYLIFGKASGFGPISLATLGTAGVKINGEGTNARAGVVSAAGDVNGDGFADILVGASGSLAAYVIFGRSNISNTAPSLGVNGGSTVAEGATDTVTSAELDFNDSEQADAAITYTVTSAATNGTLRLSGNALALNGTFTQADINANLVTYLHNGGETTGASFGFSVSDGAGGTVTGQTFSFTVTPVDDAPVAVADPTNAVNENATVAINVRANDTDVDGGTISVASINGSAAAVGNAITLASGATATLNADGTITYNPNGQFNYLVSAATAATTGASNSSATDSFSYALNGGSSATVTVTVNGVDGAGSELRGGAGANTLTGTSSNDLFNLSQGGNDTASGGNGDDGFYFGGAFDGNDSVNGGAGALDQVGLQGNYGAGVTLGANSAVGIEQFVLLPGDDTRFGQTGNPTLSYSITTGNAAIGAGQSLTFQANTLRAGESFTLNASGELDGSVFTYGGSGADVLTGSQNADAFYFGSGRFNAGDVVDGQGGSDQMALQGTYAGANAITFGAGQLLNLEMLVLLSNNDTRFGGAGSGTPYSYTLTMNNGNVAAGQTLVIQANALASDEVLTFNGAAELDGRYTIFSGNGADSIVGGALNDMISGRGGADNLTGGGGNDSFVYTSLTDSSAAVQDHILDFTSGDTISLSQIDAITGGANDAFTFIGAAAFSNSLGELRAVNTSGNDWLVEADVNGDGTADLSILVTVADAHVLGAGDFVL